MLAPNVHGVASFSWSCATELSFCGFKFYFRGTPKIVKMCNSYNQNSKIQLIGFATDLPQLQQYDI